MIRARPRSVVIGTPDALNAFPANASFIAIWNMIMGFVEILNADGDRQGLGLVLDVVRLASDALRAHAHRRNEE